MPRVAPTLLPALFVALVVGLVGPRVAGPKSHAANGPFVYVPPDGFVEKNPTAWAHGDRSSSDVESNAGEMKVWIFDGSESGGAGLDDANRTGAVHAVLHHSPKELSVEEADLARLARDMPKAFEDSCSWVHRRSEGRTRPDGARVGLIEGDCTRDIDLGALGLPPQKVRARKLQLMFPDDDGTSIVTASYPIDQAARWEPLFEATIGKARGVAIRVPAPTFATSAAWAVSSGILAWLAMGLRRRRSPPKSEQPKASAS